MTGAGKRVEIVGPGLAGPLDRAVRSLFGVSWGKARAWIAAGKVRLGGEPVTEETARVPPGAEITIDERAPAQRAPRPGDAAGAGSSSEVRVLHADPHVVVVAKPAGLSTVPFASAASAESDRERRPGMPEDTLEARVRKWVEQRGGSRRAGRPNLGVVHRLDKETTGLLVFTRTWLAKQSLTAQFRRHTVHRRYMAIAHGDVRPRTIRSVFVPDRGDGLRGSSRMAGSRFGGRAPKHKPEQAREAVTHVEPLEALAGATLVACRLETGRTHQIRIHLSEAGHPMVGERVYIRSYGGPLIEAPRLMLHAAELGFVHPATNQAMRWELPLPDDMRAVLDRLRRGERGERGKRDKRD
jgi:23S rRNA pseudouridine1911/1915/1917 synthase